MTTDLEREKEKEFCDQLRDVERNVVKSIIADGPKPSALFRIIESSSGLAETVYEQTRGDSPSQVACKEGCFWCCHQTVAITAPEAFRIAEFLLNLEDEGLRNELIEKAHELDGKTRGRTWRERAGMHAPCAFLKNQRCMIYSVRPLNCAGFTSFYLEDCKKAYREGFGTACITSEKARDLVFRAVRQGLEQGLSEALPESDMAKLELTSAVVDALSSPDAAANWLAGRPVFQGAHIIEEE